MRIYTATYLNHNYGSFLQAYALQCAIKAEGAEPVIIQQKPKTAIHVPISKRICKFLKPKDHYSYYRRIKLQLQQKYFAKKYEQLNEFRKKHLCVEYYDNPKEIATKLKEDDILLAGSDQIWSMATGPLSDWYTFKWGDLPNCAKKYSYAASIGLSDLTEQQKTEYKNALNDFEVVSFREHQAEKMLAPYLEGKARCDLDPTLLFDGGFWNSIAAPRIIEEPYIFIYMLRPDKQLIKMGRRIGKQLNCKVIYTGLSADRFYGVETVCDAGVEQFLSYIQNAEGVITNSFHGTVFSILFQKKFVSVKLAGTSSRVENLLGILELEDRYIADEKGLRVFDEPIDYGNVLQRLDIERQNSLRYIRQFCTEE